jgi:hypothetical protein
MSAPLSATVLPRQTGAEPAAARTSGPLSGGPVKKFQTALSQRSKDDKQRAAAILEVLAGGRTPTQAAQALGVSLGRYYLLEDKALAALVAACEPQPRGPSPDGTRRLASLEQHLDGSAWLHRSSRAIRDHAAAFAHAAGTSAAGGLGSVSAAAAGPACQVVRVGPGAHRCLATRQRALAARAGRQQTPRGNCHGIARPPAAGRKKKANRFRLLSSSPRPPMASLFSLWPRRRPQCQPALCRKMLPP